MLDNLNSYKPRKVSYVKRFNHSFRGIWLFIKHDQGLHILSSFVPISLGILFKISTTEWLFIIMTCGLVIIAEAFNTAIEVDIDLTSPEYHPYARDTKDISAGAVLITATMALIVASIIFLPKIFS